MPAPSVGIIAALTADSTSQGVVTVADTSLFVVNSFGTIFCTNLVTPVAAKSIRIAQITDATHLVVALQDPGAAIVPFSDLSAYTVALGAGITQVGIGSGAASSIAASGSGDLGGRGGTFVAAPSVIPTSAINTSRTGGTLHGGWTVVKLPGIGFRISSDKSNDDSTFDWTVQN